MREPWLARWQDVVCLTMSGAFVLLVLALGDDLVGGLVSAPYVAAVVFIGTWLVIDFVIAFLITRAERQAAAAAEPPREPPPPPRPTRAPLPRAVARPRVR